MTEKLIFKNLMIKYVKLVFKTETKLIYSMKVNSKSLKRTINLVIVYTKNRKGQWKHKNYFSINLE